jgi:hypothetical protein
LKSEPNCSPKYRLRQHLPFCTSHRRSLETHKAFQCLMKPGKNTRVRVCITEHILCGANNEKHSRLNA